MYVFETTVKGLPKTTNSKRRFGHWGQYHSETQRWKKMLVPYFASKKPMDGPLQKANVLLIRRSSSEPDFDGLVSSFKHILDALVDARIIEDDKPSCISPVYRWEKCKQKEGSFTVRVEEA